MYFGHEISRNSVCLKKQKSSLAFLLSCSMGRGGKGLGVGVQQNISRNILPNVNVCVDSAFSSTEFQRLHISKTYTEKCTINYQEPNLNNSAKNKNRIL